jgi:hypothetical protein
VKDGPDCGLTIQCGLRSLQLAATSCSLQHAQLYSCTHGRVLYAVLYIHIIQTFYTHSSIHPTHGVEGRQDMVFHYSILKQSLHVVGWCHSACRLLFFQGLLRGPFLWCSPISQGLPKGHRAFPSTYSMMQEVSLPQITFVGARDVWPPASCPDYLVNSMVRFVWGPCSMS